MKCKQVLIIVVGLILSLHIGAQDFIYKKNGDIITSIILETSPNSISYQVPDQSTGTIHYLSTAVIDSILYKNGQKVIFHEKVADQPQKTAVKSLLNNHHLIGIDLAGLRFYRNVTLSYEFLPGKAILGFKASYMAKSHAKAIGDYNDVRIDLANAADWKVSLGTNVYIFPPRTFRIGTGLHYVIGEYASHWYYDENIDELIWNSGIRNVKSFQGLSMAFFGFHNITKYLAVNMGVDVPVNIKPLAAVSFRMEALINF